jgi:hypothetical protein
MNKNKLKEFVTVADALSDEVKDVGFDKRCYDSTPPYKLVCHSSLISIVAEELPELKGFHTRRYCSRCDFMDNYHNNNNSNYAHHILANTLAEFLGFENPYALKRWAKDNPKLWGNKEGYDMFCAYFAFTYDLNKQITHRDIINHWKQVLKNIEEEEVKNDE